MAFKDDIYKTIKKQKIHKYWQRALMCMAMAVVFITTYMLILPAITITMPSCGMAEHIHSSECYATINKESSESDGALQTDEERVLICGREEHTHTDGCYESAEKPSGSDNGNDTVWENTPVDDNITSGSAVISSDSSENDAEDEKPNETIDNIAENDPLLDYIIDSAAINNAESVGAFRIQLLLDDGTVITNADENGKYIKEETLYRLVIEESDGEESLIDDENVVFFGFYNVYFVNENNEHFTVKEILGDVDIRVKITTASISAFNLRSSQSSQSSEYSLVNSQTTEEAELVTAVAENGENTAEFSLNTAFFDFPALYTQTEIFGGYVNDISIYTDGNDAAPNITDGTEPWDNNNDKGNDEGGSNRIVRTFDVIDYELAVGMNTADNNSIEADNANPIVFVAEMEKGLTEARYNINISGKETNMNWLKDWHIDYLHVDENGNETLIMYEDETGKYTDADKSAKTSVNDLVYGSDGGGNIANAYKAKGGEVNLQRLTGKYELTANIPGTQTLTASIFVMAAANGDTFTPAFRAYFEGNENNTGAAANDKNYKTLGISNADETQKVEEEIVTVSAAPNYNIEIRNNSTLKYLSYFDLATGKEISKITDGKTQLYGRMMGYGITLQLNGKDTTGAKGIKGLELPVGDIKFDVSFAVSGKINGTAFGNAATAEAQTTALALYNADEAESVDGADDETDGAAVENADENYETDLQPLNLEDTPVYNAYNIAKESGSSVTSSAVIATVFSTALNDDYGAAVLEAENIAMANSTPADYSSYGAYTVSEDNKTYTWDFTENKPTSNIALSVNDTIFNTIMLQNTALKISSSGYLECKGCTFKVPVPAGCTSGTIQVAYFDTSLKLSDGRYVTLAANDTTAQDKDIYGSEDPNNTGQYDGTDTVKHTFDAAYLDENNYLTIKHDSAHSAARVAKITVTADDASGGGDDPTPDKTGITNAYIYSMGTSENSSFSISDSIEPQVAYYDSTSTKVTYGDKEVYGFSTDSGCTTINTGETLVGNFNGTGSYSVAKRSDNKAHEITVTVPANSDDKSAELYILASSSGSARTLKIAETNADGSVSCKTAGTGACTLATDGETTTKTYGFELIKFEDLTPGHIYTITGDNSYNFAMLALLTSADTYSGMETWQTETTVTPTTGITNAYIYTAGDKTNSEFIINGVDEPTIVYSGETSNVFNFGDSDVTGSKSQETEGKFEDFGSFKANKTTGDFSGTISFTVPNYTDTKSAELYIQACSSGASARTLTLTDTTTQKSKTGETGVKENNDYNFKLIKFTDLTPGHTYTLTSGNNNYRFSMVALLTFVDECDLSTWDKEAEESSSETTTESTTESVDIGEMFLTPIIWDYRNNSNRTDNTNGNWERNIDWDKKQGRTNHARGAAPYNKSANGQNKGSGTKECYDGGEWYADEYYKVTSIDGIGGAVYAATCPVTVSAYTFDFESFHFPTQYGGTGDIKESKYHFSFSAGYFEVLVPFPEELYSAENASIQLTAAIGKTEPVNYVGKGETDEGAAADKRDDSPTASVTNEEKPKVGKYISYTSRSDGRTSVPPEINNLDYPVDVDGKYIDIDTTKTTKEEFLGERWGEKGKDYDASARKGDIIDIWSAVMAEQETDYDLTAANILLVFDNGSGGVKLHIDESTGCVVEPGYTARRAVYEDSVNTFGKAGEINFLYAADPNNKSGYNSLTDMSAMNKAGLDSFIYFNDLENLEKAGYNCVGILMEIRGAHLPRGYYAGMRVPVEVIGEANKVYGIVNVLETWSYCPGFPQEEQPMYGISRKEIAYDNENGLNANNETIMAPDSGGNDWQKNYKKWMTDFEGTNALTYTDTEADKTYKSNCFYQHYGGDTFTKTKYVSDTSDTVHDAYLNTQTGLIDNDSSHKTLPDKVTWYQHEGNFKTSTPASTYKVGMSLLVTNYVSSVELGVDKANCNKNSGDMPKFTLSGIQAATSTNASENVKNSFPETTGFRITVNMDNTLSLKEGTADLKIGVNSVSMDAESPTGFKVGGKTASIYGEINSDQKLTLYVTGVPYDEYLPDITFKTEISESAVNGATGEVTATISGAEDLRFYNTEYKTSPANKAAAKISVTALASTGYDKFAGATGRLYSAQMELGANKDVVYRISHTYNGDGDLDNLKIVDILPYNGDINGSKYSGSDLKLKSVEVKVTGSDGNVKTVPTSYIYWSTNDPATNDDLKYIQQNHSSSDSTVSNEVNTRVEKAFNISTVDNTTDAVYKTINDTDKTADLSSIDGIRAVYAFIGRQAGETDDSAIAAAASGDTVELVLTFALPDGADVTVGNVYANQAYVKTTANTFNDTNRAEYTVISRSIAGRVWIDKNRDNVYAEGVDGVLAGAEAVLYKYNGTNAYEQVTTDITGNAIGTNGAVVTDEDGRYSFNNLPAGYYLVLFKDTATVQLSKWEAAEWHIGGDTTVDNDGVAVENAAASDVAKEVICRQNDDGSYVYGYTIQASLNHAYIELKEQVDAANYVADNYDLGLSSGYTLPEAGGSGRETARNIGIGLVALSFAMLFVGRKRFFGST